jgi:hypothetical protein
MRKIAVVLAAAAILSATSAPSSAQDKRVNVGVLDCRVGPSIGLIVGSQQQLRCAFRSRAGYAESYVGTINRLGLDIGITAGGRMAWRVYAPGSGAARKALAGNYVGASGDISLGVGVGANALVGGSNRTIALQPVSVKGQVGANLALGVANLTLQ